jgi:hypothetical protein
MTVNEIINLLDKKENKYGGTTGKERELNLSVNGNFIGAITSAKLDGWGDGLITDVTLKVEVDGIEYLEQEIRAKAIDEFEEKIKKKGIEDSWNCNDFYGDSCGVTSCEECENDFLREIDEIAEQLKGGEVNE